MMPEKKDFKHSNNKFIKIEETKNYVIEVIRQIRGKKNVKYRRKVVYDKHGYRHVLNIAVICDGKSKDRKCRTLVTSIWHPKNEPKARTLVRKAKSSGKYVRKSASCEFILPENVAMRIARLLEKIASNLNEDDV